MYLTTAKSTRLRFQVIKKARSFRIRSLKHSDVNLGPVSSQLYQATNLALLCESVVEGMVAANSFRGNSLNDVPLPSMSESLPPRRHQEPQHNSNLEIILDIEERDWDYKVEAGICLCLLKCMLLADNNRGDSKGSHEPSRQCTKVYRIWIYHYSTENC